MFCPLRIKYTTMRGLTTLLFVLALAIGSIQGKQIPGNSRQNIANEGQQQSGKLSLSSERGGYWQYPQNIYGYGRQPYYQYPSWGYPVSGCAGSAPCASNCLSQWSRPWFSNPWQSYYPQNYNFENVPAVETQEVVQDSSKTTSRPPYQQQQPQQPSCQYAQCNGGYYGQPCGMRPSYGYGQGSLCGATGGWPSGYCGSSVYVGSYCDEYQCSNDCMMLGFSGGYCEGKCFCWKPATTAINDAAQPKSVDATDIS